MTPSLPYGGNAQHGAVFIPDVHNQALSMSGNLGKKSHQEGKTGLLKEENLSGRESSPAWSRASPERAGEQMSVGFILDLAAARGRGTAGYFGQFSKAKIENPALVDTAFRADGKATLHLACLLPALPSASSVTQVPPLTIISPTRKLLQLPRSYQPPEPQP